jgi:hypothetical protein
MNMKMKLFVAGAGAAGALAAIAAPASAATPSKAKLTITLDSKGGAAAKVCYTITPSKLDVDEAISYTEKVSMWGSDKGELKGGDDPLGTFANKTRKFTSTSQVLDLCRTMNYSDSSALNEDTGTSPEDEIYAKIVLVPSDKQLRSTSVTTQIVRNYF